jgi:hypothetical protein
LKVLRYLVTFENENRQLVRVNYADLDVEEFGSVYEGLLEYAPAITNHQFNFIKGDERSSSGSHYTPEELVKPLIVHSLDYLIADKLKEEDPEAGLLSLSICDVACGSGHILLSAARRVGFELAKYRSKEDQPTPSVLRIAIRDVIKNCIYGVDLNPLAVELCKVALWLEAHEPGQPMNFLDHHIKCGNAIVGLAHFEELENGIATEAFKTLPSDNKEIATAFRNRNNLERKTKGQLTTFDIANADVDLKDLQKDFINFTQLPENTPEQIAKKDKAYKDLTQGKKWFRLKQIADLQVAQFFIPKTEANKEKLTTQSQYISYLKTNAQIIDRGASMATAQEKHFFHWFLEFPQVFQHGGFDCILGNPPFLGGLKLSTNFGHSFINWLYSNYSPAGGTADLVTYFFRRVFSVINFNGIFSLISTNSISQGQTRLGSLDFIINNNGIINHAVKSTKWPGLATVEVALISISKRKDIDNILLDNKSVINISSYLTNEEANLSNPNKLFVNQNKSFIGSTVLGKGFILEKNQVDELLKLNNRNREIIFPFLIGDDLNSNPDQNPSRHIINFSNLTEDYCKKNYPECFEIVSKLVKPEREKVNRASRREKWWQYAEIAPNLYKAIKNKDYCFATALTGKNLAFKRISTKMVFSHASGVISESDFEYFTFLQSNIHEIWAWKNCSSMGISLRYTPSDGFQTFPFPETFQKDKLKIMGENYHDFRMNILIDLNLGLTKTYNLFHSKGIQTANLDIKDKQVLALQKHLEKIPETIDLEEAVIGIIKLRRLHKEMDEAVLEAYGWQDIALRHDFYEVDYLPENDRVRYTIHPEARKEVLKRLLELNHKIHEEEVAAGLWDKKKAVKKEKVVKKKGNVVNEPGETYGQMEIFGE